jgi:hypothetical protein
MTTTKVQFFWQDCSVDKQFRSGVSLHSHTMHSEESLEMIPRYTANRILQTMVDIVREYPADFGAPLCDARRHQSPGRPPPLVRPCILQRPQLS